MMKTKGRILVKISSLLFILYGTAELLAIILSLFSAEAAEEYGMAARLTSLAPALSVTLAILVPVLFLAAGILGLLRVGMPGRMRLCFIFGVITLLVVVADVVGNTVSGLVTNVAEIGTCILVIAIPLLYLIGTWRNWRQPERKKES